MRFPISNVFLRHAPLFFLLRVQRRVSRDYRNCVDDENAQGLPRMDCIFPVCAARLKRYFFFGLSYFFLLAVLYRGGFALKKILQHSTAKYPNYFLRDKRVAVILISSPPPFQQNQMVRCSRREREEPMCSKVPPPPGGHDNKIPQMARLLVPRRLSLKYT